MLPVSRGFSLDEFLRGAYLLHDVATRRVLRVWGVTVYAVIPATGPGKATLAVGGDVTDRRGRFGLGVSSYDITLSSGQLKLVPARCGTEVVVPQGNDDERTLRAATVGPGPVRVIPGTGVACLA